MKLLFVVICLLPTFICGHVDDVSKQKVFNALRQAFDAKPDADMTSYMSTDASTGIAPRVKTSNGVLVGVGLEEGHGFYSVPYGKPPTGGKRFMFPEAAEDYEGGELNVGDINGLACYQPPSECSQGLCFDNLSEDCLVLNVNVPSSVDLTEHTSPPSDRLPVIFWVHGGGFYTGSGTSPLYDGRYLSNVTNTIVVSINYRLGPFGFLVFNNSADGVIRNQGFADQQLALQWVHNNIEKFGGDKNKVTLMGNSAGAQSVMFHLMSRKSDPFFHRAIIQSQPAVFQYPSIDDALRVTEKVFQNLNCSDSTIDCLRDTEPEVLVQEVNRIRASSIAEADLFSTIEPFGLVLDDEEFMENPLQFVQNGGWHGNKEVLIGTNVDEMIFVPLYIPDVLFRVTKDRFNNLLAFVFGDELGEILANEYSKLVPESASEYYNYEFILGQLVTDGFFICPARALARLTSQLTSTYLYSFAHAMDDPSCKDAWKPATSCDYVFHSAENSFVFRSAPLISYNFSLNDMKSVDQFSHYWGNFAHSGDPSSGDVTLTGDFPQWPKYMDNKEILEVHHHDNLVPRITEPWMNYVINSTGYTESYYSEDICDFWDSTKYYIDLSGNDVTTTKDVVTTESVDDVVTTQASVDDEETTSRAASSSTLFQNMVVVAMTILAIGNLI